MEWNRNIWKGMCIYSTLEYIKTKQMFFFLPCDFFFTLYVISVFGAEKCNQFRWEINKNLKINTTHQSKEYGNWVKSCYITLQRVVKLSHKNRKTSLLYMFQSNVEVCAAAGGWRYKKLRDFGGRIRGYNNRAGLLITTRFSGKKHNKYWFKKTLNVFKVLLSDNEIVHF